MSEALPVLVDDAEAGDAIFSLWFEEQLDTVEIASRLMMRESYVYNILSSKDGMFADRVKT